MTIQSLRDRIIAAIGALPIDKAAQTEILFSVHDGNYDSRCPPHLCFLGADGNPWENSRLYVALKDDVRAPDDALDIFIEGIIEALQNVYKLNEVEFCLPGKTKATSSTLEDFNILVHGAQIIHQGMKAYRFDIVDDDGGFTQDAVNGIMQRYELLKQYKSDPVANKHLWIQLVDTGNKKMSGGIGLPMAIYCAKDLLGGRVVIGNANPDYWDSQVEIPAELKGGHIQMTVPFKALRQINEIVSNGKPTECLTKPMNTEQILKTKLFDV
jgi:hypothetical protein